RGDAAGLAPVPAADCRMRAVLRLSAARRVGSKRILAQFDALSGELVGAAVAAAVAIPPFRRDSAVQHGDFGAAAADAGTHAAGDGRRGGERGRGACAAAGVRLLAGTAGVRVLGAGPLGAGDV